MLFNVISRCENAITLAEKNIFREKVPRSWHSPMLGKKLKPTLEPC